MRSRIDAIVVTRRGGEELAKTLESLAQQGLTDMRTLVVGASGDAGVSGDINQALNATSLASSALTLPSRSSFPEAVNAALEHLFSGEHNPEDPDQWLWLLRDGIVCDQMALQNLVTSVEGAPLTKVAGPKQLLAERPGYLRELGESMTRSGKRIALAERELDQGQYDRLSDVLAVGDAGMFVHAATVHDVGGFDEALPALDAGLDLCVRVRLQGHRVVVVPRAVIDVPASSADWQAGKKISRARHDYLSMQAWLYRRLVYAPAWALIPLIVGSVPWAVLRGLGHLVAKRPDRMVAEPVAALASVTRIRSVLAARGRIRASRTASWDAIDALRIESREVLKKQAIVREQARARREEQALVSLAPRALPQLAWLVLALTAVAGAVFGSWWGARALVGGGALPLAPNVETLWSRVQSLVPTQWGFDASALPADPAALVFALIGSSTWWAPSVSLVWLFVGALPIAGAIAWWGLSHVFQQSWTTTLGAFVWALSPTFLIALAEGRVGAVIAHLALPWLVGSLLSSHQSWQRVGSAALAAVVVTASAPILLPAVIVGVVALVVLRGWGSPARMVAGVLPFVLLPSLALHAPRFVAWWQSVDGRWWEHLGVLFADPGVASDYVAAPWWSLAFGVPSTFPDGLDGLLPQPTVGVLVLGALGAMAILLATAVVSLAFGRNDTTVAFVGLFTLGLMTGSLAPSLFSGFDQQEATFVWPGTGASLVVLGTLVGAGSLLDRVLFQDVLGNPLGGPRQWWARSTAGAVVVATLAAPILMGVHVWGGEGLVKPQATSRTLPAFVAAEADAMPQVGTLVISPNDRGYGAVLERGAGTSLSETSTLVRGRSLELASFDEDLARLTAMLVRPSSADPMPLLEQYGIRFVLIEDEPSSEAALSLARQPGFVSASSVAAGQLWQVPAVEVSETTPDATAWSFWQQLFWVSMVMVAVLAIPTERRAKASERRADDAIAGLGEETSEND